MSDAKMKRLNNQLVKLKTQIEKFKPSDDVSKDQDDMEKIEDLIKEIEGDLEDIDQDIEEDEELQGRKPLLDKLSEQKNEFNIQKNNFNKKKDEARSAHSKELLMQGKLTGVDRKKAQRDMAIDQVKEVDEQGLILDNIHENVKGANQDLTQMNAEVKEQGEQIDRIGEKVITIDQTVKKTGEVMSEIERRNCCRKCILITGIILLFLINIIMAFLILARYFEWGPIFSSKIKGIEIENESMDFEKLKKDDYSFVMLKGGNNDVADSTFSGKLVKAKEQVKAGVYWVIDEQDENTAKGYVGNAANTLSQYNSIDYNIYLKIQSQDLLQDPTKINNICQNLANLDCGIVLSYEDYKKNYKEKVNNLNYIKNYWIKDYNKEFDEDKEEKVALWTLDDTYSYGNKKYPVIRARKK